MELVCEKYKEKIDSEKAVCRRPTEYCKFRSACLIHFLARGKAGAEKQEVQDEDGGPTKPAVVGRIMSVLRFDKGGGDLLPAIAQDYLTREILMLAYINEEAWQKTLETGKAHYWSRSRNQLWLKGESSGHVQLVKEILVDCDADTVIFLVEQLGGAACHKGYRSCFFRTVQDSGLEVNDTPVFDPGKVYKK